MTRPSCRTVGLRFMAGESVGALAAELRQPLLAVEAALRVFLRDYELRHGRVRSRWVKRAPVQP